jgi:DNA-damage-inducible protein J
MNQTTIRLEPELKRDFASVCDEMGLSVSAAITIFAKTVVRERRIPFEVATETGQFYIERKLPPPPARIVVKNDTELLAKLEEADAYAESGHYSMPEEVYERLERKYGLYDQNIR